MKAYEQLKKENICNAAIRHASISFQSKGLLFEVSFDVQKGNKIKYGTDSMVIYLERERSGRDLGEFMHVIGVYDFDDIKGTYVRVAYNQNDDLIAIGHILGDDWFFLKDKWEFLRSKI